MYLKPLVLHYKVMIFSDFFKRLHTALSHSNDEFMEKKILNSFGNSRKARVNTVAVYLSVYLANVSPFLDTFYNVYIYYN